MHADQAVDLADSLDLLLGKASSPQSVCEFLSWPLAGTRSTTPVDLLRRGQVAEFAHEVRRYVALPA